MTKWMAHPHADKLESGCQVDLCEFSQVDGDPPSHLAVGDELVIEWRKNNRSSGTIIAVSGTTGTVQVENKQIQIRQMGKGDSPIPLKSNLKMVPWIVV